MSKVYLFDRHFVLRAEVSHVTVQCYCAPDSHYNVRRKMIPVELEILSNGLNGVLFSRTINWKEAYLPIQTLRYTGQCLIDLADYLEKQEEI